MRTLRAMQDNPVVWYTLLALIVVAQLLDVGSTWLAVVHGAAEGNPLAGAVFVQYGLLIGAGCKLAFTGAVAVLLVAVARTAEARRSWAGAAMLLVTALLVLVYYLVLGNNLAIILRLFGLHLLPR